jgi:hypothetical protein
MVPVFPCRFVRFEKLKQLASTYFRFGGFHQKRAAFPGADHGVDFANQFLGQLNMGAISHTVMIHPSWALDIAYVL